MPARHLPIPIISGQVGLGQGFWVFLRTLCINSLQSTLDSHVFKI